MLLKDAEEIAEIFSEAFFKSRDYRLKELLEHFGRSFPQFRWMQAEDKVVVEKVKRKKD